MKIRTPITPITILLTCLSPIAAHAQFTLSGVAAYLSNADGSYAGGAWSSRAGDSAANLYLFTGDVASPTFLTSGDTVATLTPHVSLPLGTHVIQFAGNSVQSTHVGLNLYFNGDTATNRITAVVANDGSTNFTVVARGTSGYGVDGPQVSSGSLSYSVAQLQVILSDFHVTLPRPNLVGVYNNTPDDLPDTAGSFTLTVIPRSELLLAIELSEVRLCWYSQTNRTYQVQYRSMLTTNLWANLGGVIQGDGTRRCVADPVPAGREQRFYQVVPVE